MIYHFLSLFIDFKIVSNILKGHTIITVMWLPVLFSVLPGYFILRNYNYLYEKHMKFKIDPKY